MGDDADGVDIHGQREVVGDFVIALAGWDIDAIGAERNIHEAALRLSIGEVESHARAVGFRLAGDMVVHLEHEIGVGVEVFGNVVGHAGGLRAGGPAAQATGGKETGRAEARVTGAGIALAGGAGGVLKKNYVMGHSGIAGADVDGAEPVVFGRWGGDRETPVEVFAFGGHGEWRGHYGWQLGKPDLEAEMPAPFAVPAEGEDLYRCFAIPAPAPKDHWLRAIDIRPGNPRVVNHVILFQDTTRTARQRDTGAGYPCFGTPGFLPAQGLGGWTPGAQPARMPDDIPELLHANADLVLQVHYHITGKPETDRTRVALYFTDRKPQRRLMDIPLGSNRIDIPPGERNYKVTDHFTLPVDVDAIGIIPHAHYICKSMYGYAVLPDGSRLTLIRIPDWNFNWQQQYRYPAPIRLPADTRVEMEFIYDNGAQNPRNPNQPPKRVTWGPGTTDEMAGLHIEVVPVHADDAEELGRSLWGKMIRATSGAR